MMKKYLLIFSIFILAIILSGCLKRDKMEDIDIITTIYPIEYITNRLYGDSSTITSIYPKDVDYRKYSITNKQIKDYSSKDLFIYNGFDKEKDYTLKFLNYNKNLRIIDASYGISYKNNIKEVWLNPANFLMMAQTIKSDLQNYITNPYILSEINDAYDILKLDITELDAAFTKLKNSTTNLTIITSDNTFNFLEKYGINTINLTKEETAEDGAIKHTNNTYNVSKAEKLLSNKSVSYIYITDVNSDIDIVNSLKNKYKVETITLQTLATISDDDIKNNEDYISIMYKNLDKIKREF